MADVTVPKTPARGPRRREVAVVGDEMGGIGDVLAAAAGPARGPKPPAVSEFLTNAIKGHFLFASLYSDHLAELVSAMELKECVGGNDVLKQGSPLEHFYVVAGSVTLEVLKDGKPPPDPKKATLLPGYTFGELALIQAGAAAYTVRVPPAAAPGQDAAAVVAQVYCLSRFDFRNTVARQQAAKITEVKETLRQIELFEGLSDGNLSTLAAAVKIRDFRSGERIIQRGAVGAEMYILKKGGVVCEVPAANAAHATPPSSPPLSPASGGSSGPPVSPSSPPASNNSSSDAETAAAAAAAEDAMKRGVQQFPLGVGAWFGERALLFKDLRAADVYAAKPQGASCYTIAAKTFRDVLGSSDEVLAKMERVVKLQSLASVGLVDRLRRAATAGGLSTAQETALVEAVLGLLEVRKLKAGVDGPVCEKGQPADFFYVVKSGAVLLESGANACHASTSTATSTGSHGQDSGVVMEKGACFGEAALCGLAVRSNSNGNGNGTGSNGRPTEEVAEAVYTATVKVAVAGRVKREATLLSLPRKGLQATLTSFGLSHSTGWLFPGGLEAAAALLATQGLQPAPVATLSPPAAAAANSASAVPTPPVDAVTTTPLTPPVPAPTSPDLIAPAVSSATVPPQPVPPQAEGVVASAEAPTTASASSAVAPPSDGKNDDAVPLSNVLAGLAVGGSIQPAASPEIAACHDAAPLVPPKVLEVEVADETAATATTTASVVEGEKEEDEKQRRSSSTTAFSVSLTCPNGLTDLDVERTLGMGSFGRVKLATHTQSGTLCALKILQKQVVVETRQVRNIGRERSIMLELQHPSVLRLYGSFQDADSLYMLLELVNGGELYRLMHGDGSEQNQLKPTDALFYASQVATVYAYIHSKDIIYRDLKPENLLLTAEGYLKVIDWGFAKQIEDNTTYTMCGTPEYLAPEIVNGSGHGRAADYWSLGVVLYEMVVGYSPFVGDDYTDQLAICERITSGLVEWDPEVAVHPLLQDLVEKLLCQDPTARLGCRAAGVRDFEEHAAYVTPLNEPVAPSALPLLPGGQPQGAEATGLGVFDWPAMRAFAMPAPWKPDLSRDGAKDVSNFDDIYDEEEEEFVPYDGDVVFDF